MATVKQFFEEQGKKGCMRSNAKFERYFDLEKDFLSRIDLRGKIAVDIGAGEGIYTGIFSTTATEAIGIEYASTFAEKAIRNLRDMNNARIIIGDAHEIPLPDNSADLVACMTNMLGNMENPEKVLQEMMRITRSMGRILLSVFTEAYRVEDQVAAYEANGLHITEVVAFQDGGRKIVTQEGLFSIVFSRRTIEEMIQSNISWNFERIELKGGRAIYTIEVNKNSVNI